MLQLTTEQRIFIVIQYYSSKSAVKTKRKFATEFNKSINIKTVKRMIDKWTTNGTIQNLNKGNSGPPKSVTTQVNIALIKDRVEESLNTSVRKIAAHTQLKRESVRLILKKELNLKPYRIGMLQELF